MKIKFITLMCVIAFCCSMVIPTVSAADVTSNTQNMSVENEGSENNLAPEAVYALYKTTASTYLKASNVTISANYGKLSTGTYVNLINSSNGFYYVYVCDTSSAYYGYYGYVDPSYLVLVSVTTD